MTQREQAVMLWRAALDYVVTHGDDLDLKDLVRLFEREDGPVTQVWRCARALYTLGALRVERRMLRRTLEVRFGPVPEAVVRQIRAVETRKALQTLASRALDIDSPDRLFDPPANPP